MEKRYTIGLFFAISTVVFALFGWSVWDRHKVIEEKTRQEKILLSEEETSESETSRENIKHVMQVNGGYYIMITDGCVCVYRASDKSLYFQTEILMQDLPESVCRELEHGKYMSSEVEVYHYLESYSS